MSTDRPRSLKAIIDGPNTALGRLFRRCAETQALTDQVRDILPEPLRHHVVTVSQRDETLYVVADAAVWAARLRFHAMDILTSIGTKQGTSLQKVLVRVHASGADTGRG